MGVVRRGCCSLHNDVNIQIVIIYKKCIFIHIYLLFSWICCILFGQLVSLRFIRNASPLCSVLYTKCVAAEEIMLRIFTFNSMTQNDKLKLSAIFLSVPWSLGLIGGIYIASAGNSSFYRLIYASAYDRVTIIGLFAVLFLPLFISAIFVWIDMPALQYGICFIKAFFLGFSLCCIKYSFVNAGWLIMVMLLFSDCCMVVPLLWFWCRHISGCKFYLKRDILYSCLIAILVGILDYFVVSPYLVSLMYY